MSDPRTDRELLAEASKGIRECERNDGCLAVSLLAAIDARLAAPEPLAERVKALEAALRQLADTTRMLLDEDASIVASALSAASAALSGSTTLAEHDERVRAEERERCAAVCAEIDALNGKDQALPQTTRLARAAGAGECARAIRALKGGV